MARFAANLTFLFTELPVLERFAAARSAGFEGAEMLFPYDLAAPELSAALRAAGLEFVLMNTPPPNWAGGPRGFAAVPGGEERFRRDFDRALRFAQALRCRHLHVMAGRAEGPAARRSLVENLRWACARAPHASLLIEPINSDDMPGYFLADYDLAAELIDEVGAPNLGLQFDAYHAQRITGDAIACWDRHARRARHVQIAGFPGRHEPKGGEIDYAVFFRHVDAAGYNGWVGAEYVPATTTEAGLRWLRGTAA
ncbi:MULTISPECIES: hydroxypyruvate isomerase family protein [unclassified Paracoccus (in: a-proteobacteria)]|uniref:hydroxypyruvate isomerase family protein n=1 Tax=unclassified Paracoccus (in: a-proteobacteria) TaxID=2688777 RepID=UPI0016037251|nr:MULTISPECIES: TIM barrel protein [unclassified Paracoccus (in: a-proteobacteria)]MBB1491769.1 TIM barrel protein [Paracoccus sp. MC1854]MBB1496864.1 TIM barrel protein [Paracoccus sp. MC1862]QQO45490.1 TIM barrel protein [Paracoccus sp. MC1862]